MSWSKFLFLGFIIAVVVGFFLFSSYNSFWQVLKFVNKSSLIFQQSKQDSNQDNLKIETEQFEKNPLSGIACKEAGRRALAVMLSSDNVARPLSGISEADLVIEAPVISGSITRLMAFFVCNEPEEVGSIRSARHDFITLALGFDAIYVHWGGSHFAYELLKKKIIDNIDAFYDISGAFWRKPEIEAPHNGFSSYQKLWARAKKLNLRTEGKFEGYMFTNSKSQITNPKHKVEIDYPGQFRVLYQYQTKTNSYLRWRNDKPEIDKNNNRQVEAKNIVKMAVASRQIEGQYNDLNLEAGKGKCEVFNNGASTQCIWQKDGADKKSKLYFLDKDNQEIKFVPGQIWIEIVEEL